MPSESKRADPILPASERAGDLARARLALMRELEASVVGSRKALLGLDLAGIEHGTREQAGLLPAIAATMRSGVTPCPSERPAAQPKEDQRGVSACALELELELDLALEKELHESGERILEAVRLQAALLARARAKLRVLANMLAGPSADYASLLGARPLSVFGGPRSGAENESDSCRA